MCVMCLLTVVASRFTDQDQNIENKTSTSGENTILLYKHVKQGVGSQPIRGYIASWLIIQLDPRK